MKRITLVLVAVTMAGVVTAWQTSSTGADPQPAPPSAKEVVGASPYIEIKNEPPPKLIVDEPLPDGLPQGIVWIQYRTENCRILPVFGKEALKLSPRVGHLHVRVDDAWVRQRAEDGYFWGPATVCWWLDGDVEQPVGLFRVFDLSDLTPLIDLRIAEASRGKGIGTEALRTGTRLVFETMPDVSRLAGYTRHDNVAMQRVFVKAGWLKEAHHRRAWRVLGGDPVDTVCYAILRPD